MTVPVSIPQARIPIGYAMVQGQRVPVEVDMEWMLTFTRLLERTGGISGDTNFTQYINQFFDAPLVDTGLQDAVRTIDELRNELAGTKNDAAQLRSLCDEVGESQSGTRLIADLRNRLDDIESQIEAARPSPLPISISIEQFIAPTLLNSWGNYDATHNPAGYFKDSSGVVHLRGLVNSGTIASDIFVLPVGYRPAFLEIFPAVSNAVFGVATVSASGNVNPALGNNTYFCLDGITFRAA